MDSLRDQEEKNKYTFDITSYSFLDKLYLAGGFYKVIYYTYLFIKRKSFANNISHLSLLQSYFHDSDSFLDISGYAFSSKWGFQKSFSYLMNLVICKKFNIKVYLLPQSFGPFNFSNIFYKFLIVKFMKKYLPYARKIYSRETEGYNFLTPYSKKNIYKSSDFVLQSKNDFNLKNIFANHSIDKTNFKINIKSVAIIPNEKIFNYSNVNLYDIYKSIIQYLVSLNYHVVLIYHSTEDYRICKNIYDSSNQKENISILVKELNCIDLETILGKFDFIIASRYHSIIHSYKMNTPAIVIGWAVKYAELLENFDQSFYLHEIKSNLSFKSLQESINDMIGNLKKNKLRISILLKRFQEFSVLNEIYDDMQISNTYGSRDRKSVV
jgi:colanic acid/amylovoran biosynthesis protein